jgi:hypothetical protein
MDNFPEVDNPLGRKGSDAAAVSTGPGELRVASCRADLESALGQMGGTEEATRVFAAMDQYLSARELQLAARFDEKVEAKLGTGSGRAIVAGLNEVPVCYHQASVFFAASDEGEDAVMKGRAPLLLLGGVVLVLLQIYTAMGLSINTVIPSCASNAQCEDSSYCALPTRKRCDFCGRFVPLLVQTDPITGDALNHPESQLGFGGYNLTLVSEVCVAPEQARLGTQANGKEVPWEAGRVAAWCEACVMTDGQVHTMTQTQRIADNVHAMGSMDWVALTFATVIVACKVAGEVSRRKPEPTAAVSSLDGSS